MARKISDIKDGFALKKQKNKRGAKKRKIEDEHTIPPIPVKSILSSFTLSNPISKRAITDYVRAEKVRSKHVQIDNRGVKTVTVGNANGTTFSHAT
jgi:hypothetical protein